MQKTNIHLLAPSQIRYATFKKYIYICVNLQQNSLHKYLIFLIMYITCLVHTYPHQGNYDGAPGRKYKYSWQINTDNLITFTTAYMFLW